METLDTGLGFGLEDTVGLFPWWDRGRGDIGPEGHSFDFLSSAQINVTTSSHPLPLPLAPRVLRECGSEAVSCWLSYLCSHLLMTSVDLPDMA